MDLETTGKHRMTDTNILELQLYNTMSREKQVFKPIDLSRVTMSVDPQSTTEFTLVMRDLWWFLIRSIAC